MDASGDGIVGFMAGAAFRMGAEQESEFGEKMAPSQEYGELLGHSLYFYSKDVGQPVVFTPPSFALQDITRIPRFRSFSAQEYGCRLWWIEYGGRLDTVHRGLGARIIVVHGETIVEPVRPGTNRKALESDVDILAHPGLITEDEGTTGTEARQSPLK